MKNSDICRSVMLHVARRELTARPVMAAEYDEAMFGKIFDDILGAIKDTDPRAAGFVLQSMATFILKEIQEAKKSDKKT